MSYSSWSFSRLDCALRSDLNNKIRELCELLSWRQVREDPTFTIYMFSYTTGVRSMCSLSTTNGQMRWYEDVVAFTQNTEYTMAAEQESLEREARVDSQDLPCQKSICDGQCVVRPMLGGNQWVVCIAEANSSLACFKDEPNIVVPCFGRGWGGGGSNAGELYSTKICKLHVSSYILYD